MRIVVTGGAGFIGANLCRLLAGRQVDEVVVVDDLSTGSRANVDGSGVQLLEGSILDRELLATAMDGASSVVHLAARPSVPRSLLDPAGSNLVNVTGTVEVLEAARRVGAHVVVASSSSVYGGNPALPKHEALTPMPMSPYAVSKLATEAYALAWTRSFGLPTLAFRFFNVFGPLQAAGHAYAAVVPAFLSAALEGRPLEVHGDGKQTRDFTYVDTVADVLARAAVGKVVADRPVNLAFGSRRTLLEVIALVEELLGRPVLVQHTDPRTGDVRDSQADSSALRELFPDVRPVQLREGLTATMRWMESVVPPSA